MVLTSIAFGFHIGLHIGMKRGIEISIETAIRETVKNINAEFEKLGMGDQFKIIVNKIFDSRKIDFWKDENDLQKR